MKILEVNNLHTYFETEKGLVKAVQGISFYLEQGKTLGLVGESGSGKSQTANSILKLFEKTQKIHQGEIIFNNQVISDFNEKKMQKIRGKEISMIFQDPITSLNPMFKIKDQIMEILFIHQEITYKEAYEKALNMLKKTKIHNCEQIMNCYPYQLSGGMCQRVMIAIALICQPKLLIVDEATIALDVIVQKEILNLIKEMQKENQTAVLFISHDLSVISEISDDIIVMLKGKIIEKASTQQILKDPKHPYTRTLLNNFLKTSIIS
uniref:ABC transporter homolog n=1 Tax=Loofah witches'-broom phytoplasma TaxID=35773 RepID=Q9S511_LOWBP|nr:ABC transporter homolog [Candidatus Phytoplasma luffae]